MQTSAANFLLLLCLSMTPFIFARHADEAYLAGGYGAGGAGHHGHESSDLQAAHAYQESRVGHRPADAASGHAGYASNSAQGYNDAYANAQNEESRAGYHKRYRNFYKNPVLYLKHKGGDVDYDRTAAEASHYSAEYGSDAGLAGSGAHAGYAGQGA